MASTSIFPAFEPDNVVWPKLKTVVDLQAVSNRGRIPQSFYCQSSQLESELTTRPVADSPGITSAICPLRGLFMKHKGLFTAAIFIWCLVEKQT